MKIPILFIVFNRPKTTKEVFSTIKRARPKKLFIAADGPRKNIPGDRILCKEVRKIVERVDWPCEVKRFYSSRNYGCKSAVSKAIDWFFKNVSEGIILEDDCLPNPSFFTFCEKMLVKYRNDEHVMHISGDNFLPKQMQRNDSFYFSKYSHVWGWATWKRAWGRYDVNINLWPKVKKTKDFLGIFPNLTERLYWAIIFEAVYKGQIGTWDYQWLFTLWNYHGISVSPGVNLVKNIGFSKDKTHVNTNLSLSMDNSINLEKEMIPMNRSFTKQAEQYTRKYIYRISALMVIIQFIYYKIQSMGNIGD